MVKKKTRNFDIFANLSPSDAHGEGKKPLAIDYFKAHESARNFTYYPDIIFKPRSPYNAYGIITPDFRCNINAGSKLGEIFTENLAIAIKENAPMYIKYDERFPKLCFAVYFDWESAAMEYGITQWGWTCAYTH